MPWGSTKLVLGFVFSHGSGALKSFRLSLPQTLVMYSPGKGSGKFQESASGNMEAGMAGQATGSCQGQQGTGSGSNTLDPWGSPKTTVCSANFESSWWAKDSVNPNERF